MTTLNWIPRITGEFSVSVTPTVSTSPAYTAGDQVGGVMTLTDVIRNDQNMGFGTSVLTNISIFCKSNNTAAFEILFFRNSPTMASTDNASFNITSANALAAGYLGRVSVASSYSTSGSSAGANVNAFSTDANLNVTLKKLFSETSPTSVFAVMKTSGTPTFTSVSDLVITFNGLID